MDSGKEKISLGDLWGGYFNCHYSSGIFLKKHMRLSGIPMVPSSNGAYAGTIRRYRSKEYKAWQKEFYIWRVNNAEIIQQTRSQFAEPIPNHMIHIDCEYYFKMERIIAKNGKPKKLDSSNRIKILHDAISEMIGIDDCYFFDGSFMKRPTETLCEFVVVDLKWVKMPWLTKAIDDRTVLP